MSKNTVSNFNLRMTVYCALFTALIIIGGYISIPIPVGPVPIVLADFFVMITGLFLGLKYGLISTALYLALGRLGCRFSLAAAPVLLSSLDQPAGSLRLSARGRFYWVHHRQEKPSIVTNLIALVVGNILLYAIGVPWLKFQMNISWAAALAAGLIPFIIGIVIKITVASALGRVLLPRFKQTLVSASVQQAEIGEE